MKTRSFCNVVFSAVLSLFVLGFCMPSFANAQSGENASEKFNGNSINLDVSQSVNLKATSSTVVGMHRLYNPYTGEHFYTSSDSEKNRLVKLGWKYENYGWKAPISSDLPVYRLYNPNAGDHHYTTDKSEYAKLAAQGWRQEGIGWYSALKTDQGAITIWRQYNPNAVSGAHNFTSSESEKNVLVVSGWKDEGEAWWGYSPTADTKTQIKFDKASVDVQDKTYTGSKITPKVKIDGLTEGVDYTVTYGENTNAGTGTIVVTGKGSYSGEQKYTFSIKKKLVTFSGVTAKNKTYDGTTGAEIDTSKVIITGKISSDKLTISAKGTFDNKSVGANKKVTISGYTLQGEDKNNYTLSDVGNITETTASITVREITAISNVTACSREYNGTKVVQLNTGAAELTGKVKGDTLVVTGTGSFDDKKVENDKNVTLTDLTLTGGDASNYVISKKLSQAKITADITAKKITAVFGILANDKVYSGDTIATLDLSKTKIVGKIDGDDLSIDATGAFLTKDAGSGKKVLISKTSLAGLDKDNYTLEGAEIQEEAYADISKKKITASTSINVSDKEYNGKKDAILSANFESIVGKSDTDDISVAVTGEFDDKNVGTNKKIKVTSLQLSGADKDNYTYDAFEQTELTGNIIPKTITAVYNVTVKEREYNGTDNAELDTSTAVLMGKEDGDVLSITGEANFLTKKVGENKSVTVKNIALEGSDKGNYKLSDSIKEIETTGTITERKIEYVWDIKADNKTYDGNNTATLSKNATFVGIIEGDKLSVSGTAFFENKSAGDGKKVYISSITLEGDDKENYSLLGAQKQTETSASIFKKEITKVSNVSAVSRVYNGSKSTDLNTAEVELEGKISGDNLSITANANFMDKNVKTNKVVDITNVKLCGGDASNYYLSESYKSLTSTADVWARPITAIYDYTALSKEYDGTVDADLDLSTATLLNKVIGDQLYATGKGEFDSKNVGQGKKVTVKSMTLEGNDKQNYTLEETNYQTLITADITAKKIDGKLNVKANSKEYDGNTDATIYLEEESIEGIEGDDEVYVTGSASFDNKYAGKGKLVTISNLTLFGASSENYVLADNNKQTETTADINAKEIKSVSGITAEDKTYDGTKSVTLITSSANIEGVLETDELSITGNGELLNEHAETNKKVKIDSDSVTLQGRDKDNYTLKAADIQSYTRCDVTERELTLKWGNEEFTYDGNAHAPSCEAGNVVKGESVVVSVMGGKINAGTYTASAVLLSSPDYKLPEISTTSFVINKAKPNIPYVPFFDAKTTNTLADFKLDSNSYGSFEWCDDPSTSVGGVGEKSFKAKFIPIDDGNYYVREVDIPFSVTL